jgi:peroxiredoxin
MKKILFSAILFLIASSTSLFAQKSEEDELDLKYATEMLAPGTLVPDFTLNDIEGKAVSISDFRGRKVVLLFWASWCPDCRAEVPQIKAMQATADPSKVAFVSVSFDRTFDAFKTYVGENYLGGVQLFESAGKKESTISAAYHIKWIPSLYLLDTDGKVILGTVIAEKVAMAIEADSGKTSLNKGVCTEDSCSL